MNIDDKIKNYISNIIGSNQIITNNLPSEFFVDVLGFMYDKSDELYDKVVDFSDLCDFAVDVVYKNAEYCASYADVVPLGAKNNLNNVTFWAMLYLGYCEEVGLYYDFASLTFGSYNYTTTRYYLCEKGKMKDYFTNSPRLFVDNNNSVNNTIEKVKKAKFKLIIGE